MRASSKLGFVLVRVQSIAEDTVCVDDVVEVEAGLLDEGAWQKLPPK
jgi:hypothetical protein